MFQTFLLNAQTDPVPLVTYPQEPPSAVRSAYRTNEGAWSVEVSWRCREDEEKFERDVDLYNWVDLSPPQKGALLYAMADRYSRGRAMPPCKTGARPTVDEANELWEALKLFPLHHFPPCNASPSQALMRTLCSGQVPVPIGHHFLA